MVLFLQYTHTHAHIHTHTQHTHTWGVGNTSVAETVSEVTVWYSIRTFWNRPTQRAGKTTDSPEEVWRISEYFQEKMRARWGSQNPNTVQPGPARPSTKERLLSIPHQAPPPLQVPDGSLHWSRGDCLILLGFCCDTPAELHGTFPPAPHPLPTPSLPTQTHGGWDVPLICVPAGGGCEE